MPKIPDVNSINWGEGFNKFLTQLLDPETGSLNIWTDENKPGGITGLSNVERGKCGWNITKGCLERFDGNKWVLLKTYISEVPTPLLTSNDNTPANTEWVTLRLNKIKDDFINGNLEEYISNKVKQIVRDEIIPEVNLIMETYRTLSDISKSFNSRSQVEPSIYITQNTDDKTLSDVHISFNEDLSPVGIYISQEEGVWMGYDKFLTKDSIGNTVLIPIKGQQGLYLHSGTLPSVKLESSWVLHLVSSPESISSDNFQSLIIAQTCINNNSLV